MKVYLSHSQSRADERLAAQMREALAAAGHEVLTLDRDVRGADLVAAVSSAIRSADALVAFPASGNPNVFFEIGLATGVDLPTVLVAPDGADVPAELMSVPFVQTTGNEAQDSQEVARRLKALAARQRKPSHEGGSAETILQAAATDADAYEALSPRAFEDLVARALQERGFDVHQTPRTHDIGYDLAIERSGLFGRGLWLVECKKYSRQRLVPAEVVRHLSATVAANRATGGMLVTSSGFTASARAIAEKSSIALVGLDELLAMSPEDPKT
jgi:HJR/Mrr/RecB family endonuclease